MDGSKGSADAPELLKDEEERSVARLRRLAESSTDDVELRDSQLSGRVKDQEASHYVDSEGLLVVDSDVKKKKSISKKAGREECGMRRGCGEDSPRR